MIKTRFAPSPTGFLHVGGLRTALYAYLIAKQSEDGTFMLRIEDTDQERFVEGGVENIIKSLKWAGLKIDEGVDLSDEEEIVQKGDLGPYIQSQRKDIYKKYAKQLLDQGAAYRAFDSEDELEAMRSKQQEAGKAPMYNREIMRNEITMDSDEVEEKIENGEDYVIRLKVPTREKIEFDDKVMGEVEFETDQIDDQVLMKSDGMPTYHLANVVDDHLMEVTDVIRGEEWLSSTPKHILMYRAFEWEPPTFAHLPLLVNEQEDKLSKRHGDVSVFDYKEKGYLSEALVNFLAFLGWNPGDNREIFSLEELKEEFTLDRVKKSSSVFDKEKLNWYNKQYMKKIELKELTKRAIPFFNNAGILKQNDIDAEEDFEWLKLVVELEQERAKNLVELVDSVGFVFANELEYNAELLIWRDADKKDAVEKLEEIHNYLYDFDEENWNKEQLEEDIFNWINEIKEYGVGNVLWPLRVALTGKKNSPGPFETAGVLGKNKSLNRIKTALNKLYE
ncbi:MAG: glutamate--tRNA ligase [Parcubacteria group bacterium QH_9_35_7]|nr:MAG: glutamate--tRNA ligase [Parcubacteria group bacterium QH_9_35_7]